MGAVVDHHPFYDVALILLDRDVEGLDLSLTRRRHLSYRPPFQADGAPGLRVVLLEVDAPPQVVARTGSDRTALNGLVVVLVEVDGRRETKRGGERLETEGQRFRDGGRFPESRLFVSIGAQIAVQKG